MSVFLPKDCATWRYNFTYHGTRYTGSTEQTTEKAADAWLSDYRKRLRREHEETERRRAAGVELLPADQTPCLTDWAAYYMDHVRELAARGKISRPDRVEHLLRSVLRFWGAKPSGRNPKNPVIPGAPYHDLRLADPIHDPDWICKFEAWMGGLSIGGPAKNQSRKIAGQTRNQYRSTLSQMFKLALQPQWRKQTGVQLNPFLGIMRDESNARDVTIAREDLRRLLEHASYHVRLTVAIGALAPKLRLANILGLRWSAGFDPDLLYITVREHKTVTKTRRPLVIPISAQLREILEDARRRRPADQQPGEDFVVTYRGRPIRKSIRGGLRAAAKAAGLVYGRFAEDGLTFHTLRHTAATILAELDVAEGKRKSVLGHERLETTQRYTHLRPVHEREPVERLSQALPLTDVVTPGWRRASRKTPVGKTVGMPSGKAAKTFENIEVFQTGRRAGFARKSL